MIERRTIVVFAILGGAAAAMVAWALMPSAVEAETAAVIRGPFAQTVDEQAKTRIRDHFIVSSPLAGELDRIALREGDDVAEGSIVARLHPVTPALLDARTELELRRRVEAARASKERADARVEASRIGARTHPARSWPKPQAGRDECGCESQVGLRRDRLPDGRTRTRQRAGGRSRGATRYRYRDGSVGPDAGCGEPGKGNGVAAPSAHRRAGASGSAEERRSGRCRRAPAGVWRSFESGSDH